MKNPHRNVTKNRMVTIVVIVLMLASCSEIQHRKRKPECKAVYSLIQTDWGRDTLPGLHKIRRDPNSRFTRDILTCQDCFRGLSQDDVKKLFGTPDTTYRGHMTYYLGEPCLQRDGIEANGCRYMQCTFGNEKTVTAVEFIFNSYKH
jgi:hypothetical protein